MKNNGEKYLSVYKPEYDQHVLPTIKRVRKCGHRQYSCGDFIFTPRQIEILSLFFEGKTSQQVADFLGITTYTVKNVIENLKRSNMACPETDDIPTTTSLIVEASRLGLLYPVVVNSIKRIS